MTDTPIKVEITQYKLKELKYNIRKPYVEYTIKISIGEKEHTIKRRYNQLFDFYKYLNRNELITDRDAAPRFPLASIIDFRHFLDIAEERKPILEEFLNFALNQPKIKFDFHTRVFFDLGSDYLVSRQFNVLFILPDYDFDPTEVTVTYNIMKGAGMKVRFATENGKQPSGDAKQLERENQALGYILASSEVKRDYYRMENLDEFKEPLSWNEISFTDYDALYLPGGHAPGMKQYLENETLREKVREYWGTKKPVGASSTGVLVLSRTPRSGNSQFSLIRNKRTTCLPKFLERTHYLLSKMKYDSIYTPGFKTCEDEVIASLSSIEKYFRGPLLSVAGKDTFFDNNGFTVIDRNYISSRWPGDANTFAFQFAQLIIDHYGANEDDVVNIDSDSLEEIVQVNEAGGEAKVEEEVIESSSSIEEEEINDSTEEEEINDKNEEE